LFIDIVGYSKLSINDHKWERIGNQIDAAFIFAQSNLVTVYLI